MVHKGDDEDFCVARPVHHAKGKAFHWFDAQSITEVRVVGNFLQ